MKLEADVRDVRAEFETATRGLRADAEIGADTSGAVREVGALRAFLGSIGDKKIKVDADTRPAIAAAAALTAGLGAGSQAIDRFNRSALLLRNIAGTAARVGIVSLVGAIAPLVGMVTIAAGAVGVLAAALALLAGPAIMSVSALTNAEAASEGYEKALQSQADALDGVTQAEEDHVRVVEESKRSIEAAYRARVDAAESLRRTEITSAEAISDGRERVAEQARSLAEAERSRASAIRDATSDYRATLEDLDSIERDNAARLRESYREREQAVLDYRETRRSVAESIAEENRRLAESERAYTEVVRENRERLAELEEDYAESVQERREAFAEAAERERDARVQAEEGIARAVEDAGRAAEETARREEDLEDARRDALDDTRALRDAQAALNEAMENEPRRQADAALSVREKELELQQTIAEYQEAEALGDTDRARELALRIERLKLDLAEARDNLSDIQSGGSEELQSARDAVESAWKAEQESRRRVAESEAALDAARVAEAEARRNISLAREEGAALIAEAAKEAADLREQAVERVIESREALAEAGREAARAEREAAREIVLQRERVAAAVREGSREVAEAWSRVGEANRGISETIRENADRLAEGQEKAALAFLAIAEARRAGNAEIASQERALAEAIEQQRRTIRQARWDIADQRQALAEANESYRQSQLDADRDIRDSLERVTEAEKTHREAVEATGKAAEERGAKLTRSQQALLTAALAFGAAYKAAFAPAEDALNYLGVDVLELATRTLPYLGGVAKDTALAVRSVFEEMRGIWTSSEQVALFREFMDAVPGVTEGLLGGILKLGTAIVNVLAAAMPQVKNLSSWWDETMGDFLRWTQSPEGQRALAEFFEEASWWAGILSGIVADVATALYEIGTSQGARMLFSSLAELVDLIANNTEGIRAALWVLGAYYTVLSTLLGLIPGLKPAGVIIGGFIGTLLLFGGGSMVSSILFMWAARRALSALLSAVLGRTVRIPSITELFVRLVRRGIGPIGPASRRAATTVIRAFGRMLSGLGRIIASVPRLVARGFAGLGRFAVRAVSAILRPFAGLPTRLWRFLRGIPGLVSRALLGLWRIALRAVTVLLRPFGRVLPFVGRVFRAVPGVGRRGMVALGRAVVGVLSGVGRWFAPLLRWIGARGVLSGLLRALGPRAALALGGPGGWLGLVLSFLVEPFVRFATFLAYEAIPRLLALIRAWFSGSDARLVSEFLNFRDMIGNIPYFGGIAQKFFDFSVDLQGRIMRWVQNLGPWLSGAFKWVGESMVVGWIQGLAARAQDLFDYLVEMAKAAWNYVKGVFQISSPSKLFSWGGEMLPLGLADGVRKRIPEVMRAMKELAEAALLPDGYTPDGQGISLPTVSYALPSLPDVPSASAIRARIEGEVERRLAGTPGIGQPITLTVPVEVGGKRVDEYIITVVDGEATRRSRRRRAPMGNFG